MRQTKQVTKLLSFILLILVSAGTALAFSIVGYAPLDASTNMGTASETFSLTTDTPATIARVTIDGVPHALSCVGLTCSSNIDLTSLSEGSYSYYFFTDDGLASDYEPAGAPGTQYSFTIDRAPSSPTWGAATAYNSTTLFLNWNDNPESDINHYVAYGRRNNATVSKTVSDFSTTSATSQVYHTGLTVGDTWYYVITAVDNAAYESTESGVRSVTVTSPPPSEPTVSVSSGSCNQTARTCNSAILNPTYTINYTGSVNLNLSITSGATVVQRYYNAKGFVWPFSFGTAGTYSFGFNATDGFGQSNFSDWSMTVGDFGINFSIADLNKLTSVPYTVKGTALANGNDWLILGFNLSMYYNGVSPLYVKAKMTDLSGPSTIRIDEDSKAFIFCGENYNVVNQSWNGVGPRHFVNNTFNPAVAINCTDQSIGATQDYKIYMQIPVPAGTQSGSFSSTITWADSTTP